MVKLHQLIRIGLIIGVVIGCLNVVILTQGIPQYGILRITITWLLVTTFLTVCLLVIIRKLWPRK